MVVGGVVLDSLYVGWGRRIYNVTSYFYLILFSFVCGLCFGSLQFLSHVHHEPTRLARVRPVLRLRRGTGAVQARAESGISAGVGGATAGDGAEADVYFLSGGKAWADRIR